MNNPKNIFIVADVKYKNPTFTKPKVGYKKRAQNYKTLDAPQYVRL